MGFIDCDAHVLENDDTFAFLESDEERFRPIVAEETRRSGVPLRWWLIQDQRNLRHDGVSPFNAEAERALFPEGTKDLANVPARLKSMDELGVDVQIIFPTLWLNVGLRDPIVEAALKRSYNRWLAQATASSGGRLRWMIATPTGDIEAALAELEFGAANGAVGLFLLGDMNGRHAAHESLFPLYRRAEELNLVVGFHTGTGNTDNWFRQPASHAGWLAISPCSYAFYSLAVHRVPERFPQLKWGFFEAGCMWVPWIVQELYRQDGEFPFRGSEDWRDHPDMLQRNNFFVACQIDDDIPYVMSRAGATNLVCGSDWGHYDLGSDPAAHRIIAEREDIEPEARRGITDVNARRLFGIEDSFRPTDVLSLH
jgi:predicted TIM-barrel fold metal-dependent hydrolase